MKLPMENFLKMNSGTKMPPVKQPRQEVISYGIYNNAENRWEYDYWGDVFVFTNKSIADAQCEAQALKSGWTLEAMSVREYA